MRNVIAKKKKKKKSLHLRNLLIRSFDNSDKSSIFPTLLRAQLSANEYETGVIFEKWCFARTRATVAKTTFRNGE